MKLLPCLRYGAAALGVLLAVSAAPAHAQWKWRDSKGQVHVSDLPPPREVADKDILLRPGAKPGAEAKPEASGAASAPPKMPGKPSADPELEAKKRKAEAEQAAKTKAEDEKQAQVKAENCKRARSALAGLESGQRLARINEKGEREFVDDKQRSEEVRRTRELMAAECK